MNSPRPLRVTLVTAVVLAAMISVLLLIGQQDYEDAKRSEAQYCADVRDGVYPDYKNIFNEVCHGE